MTEAEKLCDDIVVIHDGRVMATGTLAQLRAAEGDRNLEEIFVSIASGNTERDDNSNSV
jgi:ABC-type Na+ transport system ATPase subunit NatA